MIEQLSLYVSIAFILTSLLTVWLFLRSIPGSIVENFPSRLLTFLIAFWVILQGVLGIGDFYHTLGSLPPRVFAYGSAPALFLIAIYFLLFRRSFIEKLSLRALTLVSVARIAVEIVLFFLYRAGQIPRAMTFEGMNWDILSGLSAIVIFFVAFRGDKINRPLLIVWNLFALVLLINIVTVAALAFPSPLQKIGFDQPNVAVTYFPFIWLPSVVVPTVLFTHLASLWRLFKSAQPELVS